ncbi:SDR family NAD(P)-dependent oxidoreductase [Streptomyces sp. Je 1-332]|uniref:SDR family NAD(P)-dependent oxidoreductase n=1 Tax=Streptomyces sp. Je 1-332 TaxID=3231270 RepID=UPI0034579B60
MSEGRSADLPGPWGRWRAGNTGWSPAQAGDLSGRTAVVTGSSRGIGAALVEHLARHGAHVIILCPSEAHGRAAARAVRQRVTAAQVDSAGCDLSQLGQIPEAAERITGLVAGRLDLLVNNAGVAALPRTYSAAGCEMHFAVNHLGHFALTGHLLPALLNTPQPRVVNVSSVLHWLGRCHPLRPHRPRIYQRWMAYFDSKLANLLFTHGLSTWAHTRHLPLRAIAAHPGLVNTSLGSSALHAVGLHRQARLLEWMQTRWHCPSQAAWPLLRAATEPHVTGGEFFGPGGRWEWSGPPVLVRAARRACARRAAERLWQLSQQLTGCPFPSLPAGPGK